MPWLDPALSRRRAEEYHAEECVCYGDLDSCVAYQQALASKKKADAA